MTNKHFILEEGLIFSAPIGVKNTYYYVGDNGVHDGYEVETWKFNEEHGGGYSATVNFVGFNGTENLMVSGEHLPSLEAVFKKAQEVIEYTKQAKIDELKRKY